MWIWILCDFLQAARGFVADSVLSERDLHELAVATLHIDHRQESLKAALHLLVAVYSKVPQLIDHSSLPPRLIAVLARAIDTYGGAGDTATLARQPIAADVALRTAATAAASAAEAAQVAVDAAQAATDAARRRATQDGRFLALLYSTRARKLGRAWRRIAFKRRYLRASDAALNAATSSLRGATVASGRAESAADSAARAARDFTSDAEVETLMLGSPEGAGDDDKETPPAAPATSDASFPTKREGSYSKIHPEESSDQPALPSATSEQKKGCSVQ